MSSFNGYNSQGAHIRYITTYSNVVKIDYYNLIIWSKINEYKGYTRQTAPIPCCCSNAPKTRYKEDNYANTK